MKNLTKRACAILVAAVVLVVLGSCIIPQQEIDNSDWRSVLVPGASFQIRTSDAGGARSIGGGSDLMASISIDNVGTSVISFGIDVRDNLGAQLSSSNQTVLFDQIISKNDFDSSVFTADGLGQFTTDDLLLVFDRDGFLADVGLITDLMYRPERDSPLGELIIALPPCSCICCIYYMREKLRRPPPGVVPLD